LDKSLFSPILRLPSAVLVSSNGEGAASLDSFYERWVRVSNAAPSLYWAMLDSYLFAFFADHGLIAVWAEWARARIKYFVLFRLIAFGV
jgi:hypothetical protein